MIWTRSAHRPFSLTLTVAAVLMAGMTSGLVPQPRAHAGSFSLPLGDQDLIETRVVEPLAPGVELVRIVRGTVPAAADQIATTTRGPWRLTVLSIDPTVATGHLKATYGPNLAQVERTTDLVTASGALAGVNASYFTFDKNPQFPGDPVGLGLYKGVVLSEPAAVRPEIDFIVDASTDAVVMGHFTWSGRLTNRRTGKTLGLEYLNHPPVVPAACAQLSDPTTCQASGDVVRFKPQFGPTPTGKGVEVVLDKSGCTVRSSKTRGTVLLAGQSSVQATGAQTRAVLSLTRRGCLSTTISLFDENKKKLRLTSSMFGVAGRYRLTQNGRIVAPASTGAYFARNPRTIAGTTTDGRILLVTVDGRQATSVGTTIAETAAVAHSLDISNSVNLDGGGSSTMSVRGTLANQPSGPVERAVGDALVYVE